MLPNRVVRVTDRAENVSFLGHSKLKNKRIRMKQLDNEEKMPACNERFGATSAGRVDLKCAAKRGTFRFFRPLLKR